MPIHTHHCPFTTILKSKLKKVLLKFKILTILLLFAASAMGQRVLTLEEAINIALKNNLDIQIARNDLEANSILNNIGIAGGLPAVTGSINDNQSFNTINQKLNTGQDIHRSGAWGNALTAGLSGSFLLFNGFRVYATKNRLAAIESQSKYLVNVQVQNTIAAVMTQYYNIVRQQSYMKTLRQSIAVSEQRQQLIELRKSVGLANNADTYQAQIDLNASRQQLESQKLIVVQAKTDLMNLLSQKPDTSFTISDTIILERNINIDSITAFLKNNPELMAAEQQVRINEFTEKQAAADRYPALRLNGGYNYSRNKNAAGLTLLNQSYGPFLGINLQIPIYNGGIFKRQQQVAEINTRNARLQQNNLYNQFESSAAKSWYTYQNILERLQTETENYKLTADLLSLTMKRYELANTTIIEVREAQRSFEEAGFRLVDLSYAAKLAEIELKRLGSRLVY